MVIAWGIVRFGWQWAMDFPNQRSLHEAPTPRTGGLAILAGVAAALAWTFLARPDWSTPLHACTLALILAGISLADDHAGLPILVRLVAHIFAAGLFVALLPGKTAPWWHLVSATIAIVAFTNFFNFMDGANGLAGGMAAAGFSAYGVASMSTAPGFAATCFSVAAAACAFLVFNLRGRIFMGDSGSVPLGFLAGVLGFEGVLAGYWPLWFPVAVFAPFAVDATLTLARRMLRREAFWRAHREHYYQRLVRSGYSHARLAAVEYALMAACAGGALAARAASPPVRYAILATIALLLAAAALAVDRRWRAHLHRSTLPT
ncbi:MAG: glycosyltransferase family 4 protein [Burkholderiales bacterium]|nr:glycosyltransferase family 4 protein [Burkholderiales bacterium]